MASPGAPVLGPTPLATKVELTISCENLLDMDVFSKSDPLCVLYINTSGSHWYEVCIRLWIEVSRWTAGVLVGLNLVSDMTFALRADFPQYGRTEMILNCLNPKFAKKFVIDYFFEMVQRLKFEVYDIDNNTYDLSDDDFLGEFECSLGQVSFAL